MILGQVFTARINPDQVQIRTIVPTVLVYGLGAAVMVTLGIGSIAARRWARALTLILAWGWLFTGVITFAAMGFVLPKVLRNVEAVNPAVPPAPLLVGLVVAFVFLGLFFILTPGALVLFYQSRHVKATCEARDAVPRWTDACPLPLLALSLWLGFGGFYLLAMPVVVKGVIPVFGVLLSGWRGALVYVGLGTMWLYAARSLYRLRSTGWWLALLTLIVLTISAWISFSKIDLIEIYRQMGYPEAQLQAIEQYNFFDSQGLAWMTLLGAVPFIGYMLFVKRYLRPASS